ncbi:cytochrome C biogenesis protein [Flavivirga eckloniae]|uniref:Cytochrome C biogenesis protein n=2 Tax=Flavivirga eckloniae TaxID=1803846 RepID=A0A2K9PWU1_9FLAO|nr:cytochrome C biogenesis protein [Flavivirga eckloniae]
MLWFFIFGLQTVVAQMHKPVTWRTSVVQISDTEFDLIATSAIKIKWHMYSQQVPENGPQPTVFSFIKSNDFELVDTPREVGGKTKYDPVFDMRITYFERKAVFKQRIKIKNGNGFNVKGKVAFMACDDVRCIPPKYVDLRFDVPAISTETVVKVNTH